MSVMPAPTLGRLLISHITLRGPELAQLYALIAERPGLSYDDLTEALMPGGACVSDFGLAEAPLREALNFLLVAGLVSQRGPSRRRAAFAATPRLALAPFSILLLHHIHQHRDERQRAIALVHRCLVRDDVLALPLLPLRERMERSELRDLFAWTGEKVTFWTHLASFVGLTRRLDRCQDVLLVPQPWLVLSALRWAGAQSGAQCSLERCLRMIDDSLFACFTGRGTVHVGLAQTLTAMGRYDMLRLTHSSDAACSLLLGTRRVSEVQVMQREVAQ